MPERTARGERVGGAKLTYAEVAAIRNQYAAGDVSQRELARQFGVSQGNIRRIVHGETWQGEQA